ncbi:TonB-dependent siderophore receptor [Massilia atriviolacea]|uniref:TonB-dependent siderophore receptor n=1 Tax=Massilia atriviolacea TaxID=2495579 RepID=A0A430HEH5_9BURK|nr:TonB-dependent siderophore receptor [Massilia atriviolacea]RSZ55948.1 TonB-dependent siderophore receptor [Massilia atriviolacea]
MPQPRPTRLHHAIRSACLGLALAAPLAGAAPVTLDTAPLQSYKLPAGPLGRALSGFAVDAGIALSFDPALTEGLMAAPLAGSYPAREAAARLLAGSGLELAARADGSYTLKKSPAPAPAPGPAPTAILPGVTVTASAETSPGELPDAYAGGQVARGGRLGMLGNIDAMDTPFNLTSYTAQAIENQQAATIADVVARDPSVRSTAPSGDVADSFFIRGFAIGDNNIGEIAFDGLYGVAPNYRLLADYAERVDVLKGPAAMVYGMSPNSGVGGSINVVPKRAGADLTRVQADYAGSSQAGARVDLARRFGPERAFGARFNGGRRSGDTAIDMQSRTSSLGALALDYQGQRLRATLDLIDQREDVDAPSRRPWLSAGLAVPRAPDGRTNLTQRWEWYDSRERSALLRADVQAHERLTLFASAGTARSDVDRLFNTPSIVNAAGDTTVLPTRAVFDVERSALGAGLRARLSSGAVRHQLTLEWSQYQDRLAMGTRAGRAYTSNMYAPVAQPAQDVAAPAAVAPRSTTRLGGVALADMLSMFDERLQVMLGLRRQTIRADTVGAAGIGAARYQQSAVTPMAGVVLKPWRQVSLYANHIGGLSKGDSAPDSAVNAGEAFAPYKAKQNEIGAKLDHGSLVTTVSLFQITRPSGQLTANRYAADAEQRNRGIEVNAYGKLGEAVRLYGGASWTDAELVKTNSAATLGNTAVGVPTLHATMSAEWDLAQLPGLTLTGALQHSGAQYANQANTQRLDSWTSVDLGARYRGTALGKPLVLRAGLRNAAGKHYWAGASTWGTLIAGAPRSVVLSAALDF